MKNARDEHSSGADWGLGVILFACWAIVVAKVTLLFLGKVSPAVVETSYIVAFPVAVLNLRRGRELLGGWFFVGLLLAVAVGATGWLANQWQNWLERPPEGVMATALLFGSTVLAVNFFILLFCIGRELLANPAVLSVEEAAPDHSPTA